MALGLAPDTVTLHPPGEPDPHGWVEPAPAQLWAGAANLQLQPGRSDPRAMDGGGHGPHDPARGDVGVIFLPEDAPAEDGTWVRCRGTAYVLSQVRLVVDPHDHWLDCLTATVTQADRWASGGA